MTENTQAQPQQASNDLNINDLNAMKVIIDIASQRGAFKPGQEMVAVGNVYAKLDTFLQAVAKQAEAQKAAQQQAAQSEEDLRRHNYDLEQKQIQCDILESELLKYKKENAKLLAQIKSILDLPKQLGKNLGK